MHATCTKLNYVCDVQKCVFRTQCKDIIMTVRAIVIDLHRTLKKKKNIQFLKRHICSRKCSHITDYISQSDYVITFCRGIIAWNVLRKYPFVWKSNLILKIAFEREPHFVTQLTSIIVRLITVP